MHYFVHLVEKLDVGLSLQINTNNAEEERRKVRNETLGWGRVWASEPVKLTETGINVLMAMMILEGTLKAHHTEEIGRWVLRVFKGKSIAEQEQLVGHLQSGDWSQVLSLGKSDVRLHNEHQLEQLWEQIERMPDINVRRQIVVAAGQALLAYARAR